MMSESGRVFVAGGVLIGALTLAALGLRFGNRESAANEADGRIDTSLASAARPITPITPGAPGAPDASVDDPQNAGIARVLQAVHDSLQSGDLASAHLLLDAVLTMRKDEPQALLLQKELSAREAAARAARQARAAAPGEPGTTRPHAHLHASAKAMFARTADTSDRSTDTANDDDNIAADAQPPADIRSDSSKDVAAETTGHAVATSSPQTQPEPVAAPTVQSAAPTAEPVDKPIAPIVTSTSQNDVSPTTARNAPKTRAEVRDELSRARRNGTMSRFGNPDPYGPGGSPSYSAQPSIRTW
jgi:hypothetical protein